LLIRKRSIHRDEARVRAPGGRWRPRRCPTLDRAEAGRKTATAIRDLPGRVTLRRYRVWNRR